MLSKYKNFRAKLQKTAAAVAIVGSMVALGQSLPAFAETKSNGMILIMNQPAGNPFANLVFSGAERLSAEMGIPAKQVAGVQAGAYEQHLRAAAKSGFDPVMVLWDDLGNAVGKIAPSFPDTHFVIIDSTVNPGLPNVASLTIDSIKSSYLAGVVGANLSKSGQLAFVGGQDMGVVNDWGCGFKLGVAAAKPSANVITTYAGTFTDPKKGEQIAASMKGQGVDVIFHAANQTGLGVLTGAAQNGMIAIGSDSWQGDVAKGSVPWSALKDAGQATYHVAKNALAGTFESGIYVYDAEKGAPLYDARDFDALSPELQAIVKTTEAGLRDGSISVSCN
ncbi:BMP family ABC transporter substrate-binding protein [Shinella sp.]|uniref:BMP family ABC transporter substrate-binding protein n=1 Tax=Shinella sp. TaxID=1870904 RepID=UPI00258B2E42|nr:BMP family ABC transporter substrate-binding protein [Shinella sp.]MCW5710664.1 BMP family ABC transporter substrate-binding protein [Shinella sp.]